ncbi:MAG: hypothetical protein AAGC85_08155 [Bacteroidota bacterium]
MQTPWDIIISVLSILQFPLYGLILLGGIIVYRWFAHLRVFLEETSIIMNHIIIGKENVPLDVLSQVSQQVLTFIRTQFVNNVVLHADNQEYLDVVSFFYLRKTYTKYFYINLENCVPLKPMDELFFKLVNKMGWDLYKRLIAVVIVKKLESTFQDPGKGRDLLPRIKNLSQKYKEENLGIWLDHLEIIPEGEKGDDIHMIFSNMNCITANTTDIQPLAYLESDAPVFRLPPLDYLSFIILYSNDSQYVPLLDEKINPVKFDSGMGRDDFFLNQIWLEPNASVNRLYKSINGDYSQFTELKPFLAKHWQHDQDQRINGWDSAALLGELEESYEVKVQALNHEELNILLLLAAMPKSVKVDIIKFVCRRMHIPYQRTISKLLRMGLIAFTNKNFYTNFILEGKISMLVTQEHFRSSEKAQIENPTDFFYELFAKGNDAKLISNTQKLQISFNEISPSMEILMWECLFHSCYEGEAYYTFPAVRYLLQKKYLDNRSDVVELYFEYFQEEGTDIANSLINKALKAYFNGFPSDNIRVYNRVLQDLNKIKSSGTINIRYYSKLFRRYLPAHIKTSILIRNEILALLQYLTKGELSYSLIFSPGLEDGMKVTVS